MTPSKYGTPFALAKAVTVGLIVLTVFACTPGLIGQTVPPYPTGLASYSGACVGQHWSCDYAIAILHKEDKTPLAVLGQRNAQSGDQEKGVWQVTDQIDAPKLATNENLILGQCRLNGVRIWA